MRSKVRGFSPLYQKFPPQYEAGSWVLKGLPSAWASLETSSYDIGLASAAEASSSSSFSLFQDDEAGIRDEQQLTSSCSCFCRSILRCSSKAESENKDEDWSTGEEDCFCHHFIQKCCCKDDCAVIADVCWSSSSKERKKMFRLTFSKAPKVSRSACFPQNQAKAGSVLQAARCCSPRICTPVTMSCRSAWLMHW